MKGHLLIVEDDAALNYTLGIHFEEQGYRIANALSVAEALKCLADTPPDVALVDHQLPDGTGLALLGQLRARQPRPAIIMMSGLNDPRLATESLQQGASEFIRKPFRVQDLEPVLRRVVEQRHSPASLNTPAEGLDG